jgi:uncharacterized protein
MKKKMSAVALAVMLGLIMTTMAVAAQYDIKTMTPQIKAAFDNRRTRFSEVSAYKQQGVFGENNRGYIDVFSGDSTSQSLANAENLDRQIIYKAIAEQNGLTGALNTIESVFANTQRTKAQAGERIQLENGQWVNK